MSFNNFIENTVSSANANGQFLENQGVNLPGQWSPASGSSGFTNIKQIVITSSSVYTPSAGLAYAVVELVGGGGGGGGIPAYTATGSSLLAASGGGAGGYTRKLFTALQIGASQSVVIGGGGAGGVGNGAPSNGGNSTFGAFLTATGGSAGVSRTLSSLVYALGGDGGVGSGGDINLQGGFGEYLIDYNSQVAGGGIDNDASLRGGAGGSSFFGSGGDYAFSFSSTLPVGNSIVQNGYNAFNYGAGGSGASSYAKVFGPSNPVSVGIANGGAGASGVCIITEYII